jgi:hypothetical protein
MENEDRQKTLEITFYETMDRLIQKCKVLDEKMLREGKRPVVTDTLRGFIPSHNVRAANIAESMEYILDLENEIDSLINYFNNEKNPQ